MLNLTSSERKALLIVAIVLFFSLIIQWIRPHNVNSEMFDYSLEDSLFKVLSADTVNVSTTEVSLKTEEILKHSSSKQNKLKPKSIYINKATKEELILLPRIGPVTAEAIIEFLKTNGPINDINELQKVKRIGPKTIEKIAPFIIVDSLSTQ